MIKVWVILTFFNIAYASTGHEIGPYHSEEACEAAKKELLAKTKEEWDGRAQAVCIWKEPR